MGSNAFSWVSQSGTVVRMYPPRLSFQDQTTKVQVQIGLDLASQSNTPRSAVLKYNFIPDAKPTRVGGTCEVKVTLSENSLEDVLLYNVHLTFDEPIRSDLITEYSFEVRDKFAPRIMLPELNGYVRSYPVKSDHAGQAHFLLGYNSAAGGPSLALPAVNLEFDRSMAIATDPYCGAAFRVNHVKDDMGHGTELSISSKYCASKVPLTSEKRTIAFQFHGDGPDGMLSNYYHTIPDIKPGAAWIHDIHLNYYDYLSDKGQGWFTNIAKLAEVIPVEHRKSVVVALHGWYDYLGRYSYDHNAKRIDEKWNAFNLTNLQHAMSKTEMHKRIRFAKELGFRVVLYFADGTSSDSGLPTYRKDWEARDENGRPFPCWMGPGVIAQTYAMDPSDAEVQQWFRGYLTALLEEYSKEVDGFVWDETFQFPAGTVTKTKGGFAYADRGMMVLTAELTKLVQSWHDRNRNLVFLTSDDLGMMGPSFTALVSHGTYQDSHCNPMAWPAGMLINYRNCLISCNWSPVTHNDWNRIAAEQYELPQGVSDGYGDYKGPAKMDKAMLDAVCNRFLGNIRSTKQRTKYLFCETRE